MSFEGLDPEQLQNLARRINADAQALEEVITSMTGVMGTLALFWHGPAATTFGEDWALKFRPSLQSAYDTLMDLHGHLVSNVDHQSSASAADAGFGGTVKADIAWVWRGAQKVDEWTSPIDHALEFAFPEAAAGLPVFTAMRVFGMVMGVANTTEDLWDVGESVRNHQYAAAGGDAVDATAEGLKTAGDATKNPELYLTGVAIDLIKTDYDLAGQYDWQQGVPSPFSGDNWQTEWLPSIEDAPEKAIGPILKAFR